MVLFKPPLESHWARARRETRGFDAWGRNAWSALIPAFAVYLAMLWRGTDGGEALSDLGWALTAFVAAFFLIPAGELCWNRLKAPRQALEEENKSLEGRVLTLEKERDDLLAARALPEPVSVECGKAYFIDDSISGTSSKAGHLYCVLPRVVVVNPDPQGTTIEFSLAITGKGASWMMTESAVQTVSKLVLSRVEELGQLDIVYMLTGICDVGARASIEGALCFRLDVLMLHAAKDANAEMMALIAKDKMTGREQPPIKLPTALARLADLARRTSPDDAGVTRAD